MDCASEQWRGMEFSMRNHVANASQTNHSLPKHRACFLQNHVASDCVVFRYFMALQLLLSMHPSFRMGPAQCSTGGEMIICYGVACWMGLQRQVTCWCNYHSTLGWWRVKKAQLAICQLHHVQVSRGCICFDDSTPTEDTRLEILRKMIFFSGYELERVLETNGCMVL